MKIKNETSITLTPTDVEEIIKQHFSNKYEIESVYFNVEGVEDPADWRSEYPLSYEMTEVRIKAKLK